MAKKKKPKLVPGQVHRSELMSQSKGLLVEIILKVEESNKLLVQELIELGKFNGYLIEVARMMAAEIPNASSVAIKDYGKLLQQKVLEVLNSGVEACPEAMSGAMLVKFLGNDRLADKTQIVCTDGPLGPLTSGLGILNGVLTALRIPIIAAVVGDNDYDKWLPDSKFISYDTPIEKPKKRRKK